MCRLLETIKVSGNTLHHIEYHTARVNHSRRQLFGKYDRWDLSAMIQIPRLDPGRIYRCRFLYGAEPEKTEFIPYVRREIRRLYVVEGGSLDYSFKYADRTHLEVLLKHVPDPETSDILIVKEELITDASFANLVFTDGHQWYTPVSPLLRGTRRQYYLDRGVISEREIRLPDLHLYKSVRLINALTSLEESHDIPVEHIIR